MTGDSPLFLSRPLPGCALLALNRPQALNALSAALRSALVQALHALADDDTVRGWCSPARARPSAPGWT